MLPTRLLTAVAQEEGGRVVLVLGAGCSKEAPTSLPLARELAEEAHRRLVADHVLSVGDCEDFHDLSALAETVFEKTGRQLALVERMNPLKFRQAVANEGYKLAAALLREHAIAAVLTLNFDLAIFNAISSLGGTTDVSVILGPEDHIHLQLVNVVFMHRSANADPEEWILRASKIEEGWHDHWEQVVAQRFLASPVVVFVGLGSPARVLIETAKLVKKAIPAGSDIYQVDIVKRTDSAFFKELGLPETAFIEMGWTRFVSELSARVLEEHQAKLKAACEWLISNEGIPNEDAAGLCARLAATGVLNCGSLRANWLLDDIPYVPFRSIDPHLIADLLLAVGLIERQTQSTANFDHGGIVEFRQGATILARVAFASGRGIRRWFAMEAALETMRWKWGLRQPTPTTAVLAGVNGNRPNTPLPVDISGQNPVDDISGTKEVLRMHSVDELRNNPDLAVALFNLA